MLTMTPLLMHVSTGGAQNIKMKGKDKAEKSEKAPKGGGIKSLRGIM